MSEQNKSLLALGIPFSALVSVIFGLMILSFPIGAYVVFNSSIEDKINYDYPLTGNDVFPVDVNFEIPFEFQLGDIFIFVWCIFIILFTIAMLGPKKNFLKSLSPLMTEGKYDLNSNYLVSIVKWFSILIVISILIDFIQESVGVPTEPPEAKNLLLQFFDVTTAPIIEEIGFRVFLIGLPLFLVYSHKASFLVFLKSLWNPTENLHIFETKKALILIILVGIFFGAAHIFSGEPWTGGKFAQASASGIILGWVYLKHGLVSAILVHWSTNYFIFSYIYFLADINEISIQNAFSHSLTNTFEILLIISGVLSIGLLLLNYLNKKKEEKIDSSMSDPQEKLDNFDVP
ncbi:MAG: Abortive infection protein [Nitrosopumilales archaeon]|nr:MAG: Abortive infection protein [Nitrosopumilales archaeon]